MKLRLLSFALVLLVASCAQTLEPGGAGSGSLSTLLATLSTDLKDVAYSVAADAKGNAYVLGYRNYRADYPAGPIEHPVDLFVSQLGPKGALNWLTNLPSSIVSDELNVPGIVLELAAIEVAVYVLTFADTGVTQLHSLEFDGTLSWSKVIAQGGYINSELPASANGTLYIAFANSSKTTVKALDSEGIMLWSKVLLGTPLTLLSVGEVDICGEEDAKGVYLHKVRRHRFTSLDAQY